MVASDVVEPDGADDPPEGERSGVTQPRDPRRLAVDGLSGVDEDPSTIGGPPPSVLDVLAGGDQGGRPWLPDRQDPDVHVCVSCLVAGAYPRRWR